MAVALASVSPRTTLTTRALVVLLGLAISALGALALPARVGAATVSGNNGVQLTVTPTAIDTLTNEVVVSVSGSGYSTTANSAFGIYVSFGPQPDVSGGYLNNPAFQDASRYYNGGDGKQTFWVTPGTPNGPNQAKLNGDGTFSVQVAVKASYTGADANAYSSTTHTLGVLTYGAHGTEAGASAFSQYAFVPLTFDAGSPATEPAAPAQPTVSTSGTNKLNVSWTAPDDGGSDILGYTISLRYAASGLSGSANVAGTFNVGNITSTQLDIDPDSSYNVTVAATNSVGTGAASPGSAIATTGAASVGAAFSGLRWKISHNSWWSSSLSTPHEVSGGAQKNSDGFLFPSAGEGTYDATTDSAHAEFSGSASLGNTSQGGYRIWFADPHVDIDDGQATISANVSYRTSAAGSVTDRGRLAIATFTLSPSAVTLSDGHLVIQQSLDAAFSADLLTTATGLPVSLQGHFKTSGAVTDPLKPASPVAMGFDVPDDPLNGFVTLTTQVEETGALVLSVEDGQVDLGTPLLDQNGDLYAYGDLGGVTVIDLRSGNPGWSVTGQVSDFDGPNGDSIDGAGLSWDPYVTSTSDGQTVAPGDPGAGLKSGQTLGSAEAGEGRGTAVMGADLVLSVPSSTEPGTYTARLTLTAI